MKKTLTLHEKLARMQAEEWLKKTTIPITLAEIEAAEEREKEEEASISLEELQRKVQKVIADTEQFFARFGLTPEGQEELFKMPIIQRRLDEVITGVAQEREELERSIGRPRNGWDLLPFEKLAETEKMLEKLPKTVKAEKVQEICVDKIFDRSAQEQIAAIQERLAAALVDVKKAAEKQKEEIKLSPLSPSPKRETSVEMSPSFVLPDLQEKRPIDIDFKRHYAEQFKIVVPREDVLSEAIVAGNFSSHSKTKSTNDAAEHGIHVSVHGDGEDGAQEKGEVRSVEAIRADIEKMTAKNDDRSQKSDWEANAEGESLPVPATFGEVSKISRKSPTVRPHQGVIISALRARIHHENEEKPAIITENVHSDARPKEPLVDFFAGMTLPGLPLSAEVPQVVNDRSNGENKANNLEAHRRQVGPFRLHL